MDTYHTIYSAFFLLSSSNFSTIMYLKITFELLANNISCYDSHFSLSQWVWCIVRVVEDFPWVRKTDHVTVKKALKKQHCAHCDPRHGFPCS